MAKKFLTPLAAPSLSSAPSGAVQGWVYFDTTTQKFRVYTSSGWVDMEVAGSGGGDLSSTLLFMGA